MDPSKEPGSDRGSVADFRRRFLRKIADKTVAEPARDKGASPADLSKRSLMVERAERVAASFEETLVPASRVRELKEEIEELKRLVGRQEVVLEILEKKGIVSLEELRRESKARAAPSGAFEPDAPRSA